MRYLQAAIFDMDGLMIDSEHLQWLATNAALAPYSVRIEEAQWAGMIGRRALEILTEIKSKHGLDASVEELLSEKNKAYRELIRRDVPVMSGLYKAIDNCRQAGLRMALASSSILQDITLVLNSLRLASVFEVIVSGDEVTHGKPDPEIFLAAARLLEIDPANCLVLEDTTHGVEAAKAAGMVCVAVPNNFAREQDFRRADVVLHSLDDLDLNLLTELSRS